MTIINVHGRMTVKSNMNQSLYGYYYQRSSGFIYLYYGVRLSLLLY